MTVKVVKRSDRKYLVLRWRDPENGREREKSSRTTSEREARKIAAKLEAEIESGRYFDNPNLSWADFRELFETEKYPNVGEATVTAYESTLNVFENLIRVAKVSEIDALKIVGFQNKLRKLKRSDATVAKHLRHIKAVLRWAYDMGVIQSVPKIVFPKAGRFQQVMKGRPITQAEFDLMLEATEKVVGSEVVESWNHLLKGLWFSGLRLGEALKLTWHPSPFCIDFTGEFPMFSVEAGADKSGRRRRFPVAPDFAYYLDETGRRTDGFVFNVRGLVKGNACRDPNWVSKIGSRIGQRAKVIVGEYEASSRIKYASFHDLRRSFGQRWSLKLLPQKLMKLMRHDSIDTTLRYYVGDDSDDVARELWTMTPRD